MVDGSGARPSRQPAGVERQPDLVVDLTFPLRGTAIPADHGYLLYSAISRLLPTIHGDEAVGIHPVRGQLVGQRQLALSRYSQLAIRLPAIRIPEMIRLAGQRLEFDDSHVLVGVPTVRPLRPAAALVSRLVVIQGFTEAEVFLEAARRQLADRGITGSISLVLPRRSRSAEARTGSRDAVVRRTLRVKDKEIVGFAVRVGGLNPPDSVTLQTHGLGGRRRFGCGIFLPMLDGERLA